MNKPCEWYTFTTHKVTDKNDIAKRDYNNVVYGNE
jgi:hypothetical protein